MTQAEINQALIDAGILPIGGKVFPVKLHKANRKRLAMIGAQTRYGSYSPTGS